MTTRLIWPLVGGAGALVVAMGIGRFAYTPILPLMERQAGLSAVMAGYLGAANHLGYLVGAAATSLSAVRGHRQTLLRLALILNLVATGGMGLLTGGPAWLTIRFLSGITSAAIFVLSSSLVLDALAAQGRKAWSGIFYGGVGLGIVVAGLSVPLLDQMGGWRWAWGGLALVSIPFAALPWLTLRGQRQAGPVAKPHRAGGRQEFGPGMLPWLIAAYGLEGLGYIVTGTFLVSVVERMVGGTAIAAASWVLVGLAAAPSAYGWTWLAGRWGYSQTLVVVFLLQAVGIALPAFSASTPSALVGAMLFGATFMGITTLSLSAAQGIRPNDSAGVIGTLTAVYGTGQVVGPVGAGMLMAATQTYQVALLVAAGVVGLGAILLAVGHRRDLVNASLNRN
jgi:predicted MFS family arabinose efflux permease